MRPESGFCIAPTGLFKSLEFRNRSRMSDEKFVILQFKYLQKKKIKLAIPREQYYAA